MVAGQSSRRLPGKLLITAETEPSLLAQAVNHRYGQTAKTCGIVRGTNGLAADDLTFFCTRAASVCTISATLNEFSA